MKKKIVFLLIFVLTFSGLFILNAFIDDNSALDEKKELAEFPTEYSDDYFSKISAWFSDRSPLRNTIIKYKTEADSKSLLYYALNIAPKIDALFNYESGGEDDYEKQLELLKRIYGEDSEELEKLDTLHNYDEGEVIKEATCSENGETRYTCKDCGYIKVLKTAKSDHNLETVYSREASVLHDGVTVKECTVCGKRFAQDIVLRSSLEEFKNTKVNYSSNNGGVLGKFNWLFTSIQNSIGYYEGSNILSEAEMAEWTAEFKALKDVCDEKGIQLVVFVGPNKEQIYSEYMPDNIAVQTDEKRVDVLAEYINANSDVTFVYPKDELIAAKVLYETYYMQDTHWNTVGAYVGVTEIYKALGLPYTELLYQNVNLSTYRGGDLSNFTGVVNEYDHYELEYKPELSVTTENYYNSVSNSVSSELVISYNEDADNKNTIMVIGDSFRNGMKPTLQKDFAKTVVAHGCDVETVDPDLGYSVVADELYKLTEGDILVIECVERDDASLLEISSAVRSILESR